VLLRNEGLDRDGVPRFANVAMAVGADQLGDGRGAAYGDIDNDGDVDIVMNSNPGDCGLETSPPLVLRNDLGQRRNWLAVELVGTRTNREAIGAEVTIECAGSGSAKPLRGMRHVHVGSGYASQNDHRLQFGLGEEHKVVTSLKVRWPGRKAEQTFKDIPANRWVRIREGGNLEFFDPRAGANAPQRLAAAPQPGRTP
jgi:enediyne biosynthesis protein E4